MASNIRVTSDIIAVRVDDLDHVFKAVDASPPFQRDVDAEIVTFVMSRARAMRPASPAALVVHVDTTPVGDSRTRATRDAISDFFRRHADARRRDLTLLFRVGRRSLLIGLGFVTLCTALGHLSFVLLGEGIGGLLRESFAIGAWVALWRPMEIFLYDWWPIRDEARCLAWLAIMPVRIEYARAARAQA